MKQPGAIFADSLGQIFIDKVEANKFLILQTDNDFNWRNTWNISSHSSFCIFCQDESLTTD
jgi:hypothetical protein